MEEHLEGVAFPPRAMGTAEGQMLRADLVREMVARRERGESTRQIARELAADRTTVRRWLRLGGWQPRQGGERPRAIDPYIEFIEQRGPEVDWNGVVLHRELMALGVSGSYQQVQRLLRPRRARRGWQEAATVRFETEPGEQAQVDYGQLQVWIEEHPETVHLFVLTLGYSRRLFTRGYRNERLATLLDGHERAFRHFGGGRSAASMIIRARWCWGGARTRCCGIRCSRILPVTTGSRRGPASRIGRALRARSRAG